MRFFNTVGPCEPHLHYMLSSPRLTALRVLIERQHYVVLHAPPQSGKTTLLRVLARTLTDEGEHAAVLLSSERAAAAPLDDLGAAEQVLLCAWREAATAHLPAALQPPPWPAAPPGDRIGAALWRWARACPRPLVLFLEAVDALPSPLRLSLLCQLHSGSLHRPHGFPSSVFLCGVRDAYLLDHQFTIAAESLRLQPFARDEIATLFAEHTHDTGQIFTVGARDKVEELSGGQPWLVSALAAQMVEGEHDRTAPLTATHAADAAERLLAGHTAHLAELAAHLRDPRVRRALASVTAGRPLSDMTDDDLRYARDLGLVARDWPLRIANAMYKKLVATTSG